METHEEEKRVRMSIAELKLHTLQDDAHYLPRYDAVLLYRADLPQFF